ncbi:hypothetical protein BB561_003330 [Smittium simulii]|uniref:Uncharacterized protein n=1 Tax=Smittium simulii TaxID=133385 RepID=A0A2T9YLZ4_9FUNG|nr:hypothetical protein BB561_003330 [Smittium simulii]
MLLLPRSKSTKLAKSNSLQAQADSFASGDYDFQDLDLAVNTLNSTFVGEDYLSGILKAPRLLSYNIHMENDRKSYGKLF